MNVPRALAGVVGGLVILALVAIGANAVAVGGPGSALEAAANGSITVNGSLGASVSERPPGAPPRIDASLDGPPTDPDGDGRYEDTNGNGRADFDDVVVLFEHIDHPVVGDHAPAYDFNGNGRMDYDDVVALFGEI